MSSCGCHRLVRDANISRWSVRQCTWHLLILPSLQCFRLTVFFPMHVSTIDDDHSHLAIVRTLSQSPPGFGARHICRPVMLLVSRTEPAGISRGSALTGQIASFTSFSSLSSGYTCRSSATSLPSKSSSCPSSASHSVRHSLRPARM